MIVSYFDVGGARVGPYETDAILVVDSNAVFPAPISSQSLKPVTRRYAKIVHNNGRIELV